MVVAVAGLASHTLIQPTLNIARSDTTLPLAPYVVTSSTTPGRLTRGHGTTH